MQLKNVGTLHARRVQRPGKVYFLYLSSRSVLTIDRRTLYITNY